MRKSGVAASCLGVVQARVEFRAVVGYFARGYTPNKEIAEAVPPNAVPTPVSPEGGQPCIEKQNLPRCYLACLLYRCCVPPPARRRTVPALQGTHIFPTMRSGGRLLRTST